MCLSSVMLGISSMTHGQRLAIGVLVLLLVDIIWVASSELTEVSVRTLGLTSSHGFCALFTNELISSDKEMMCIKCIYNSTQIHSGSATCVKILF